MKTNTLLKTLALVAILFVNAIAASASKPDGNLIYNTEEKDGVVLGQTIYRMDGNTLTNHIKQNYQYDDQQRVTQSEMLKWDSSKQNWENNLILTYTYSGKTVTTNYFKWDKKKKEYVLVPEMTVTMDNRDN